MYVLVLGGVEDEWWRAGDSVADEWRLWKEKKWWGASGRLCGGRAAKYRPTLTRVG